jgi:hypothetical protein
VRVHDDLASAEGDQSASAHRVVGNDCRDGAVVVGERGRDLTRGDDEPAGRVEDDLDRLALRSRPDRPQRALRVVDVDVAHERKAQERHRLLAVDERDHGRTAGA